MFYGERAILIALSKMSLQGNLINLMMDYFLDEVKIYVRAGNGGNGCISFRREKYVPRGGPDGGNGGEGGNIILKVDKSLSTLYFFHRQSHFSAPGGEHGKGKNRDGKRGKDLILKVSPGTLVKDETGKKILIELKDEDDFFMAAKGGRGGRGNTQFKTSINRAPRRAEAGEKGEERCLNLEMRLIADAGIMGFPNAGKSTLLSQISNAHPRIAPYPFTTLRPYLGIVRVDEKNAFVAADLPGLIENASSGRGLGDRFLRHIERSRVLLHMIDMGTSQPDGPMDRFDKLNKELKNYSPALSKKAQLIVANKMDLPGAKTKLLNFKRSLGDEYPLVAISALKKEGLKELLKSTLSLLKGENKK